MLQCARYSQVKLRIKQLFDKQEKHDCHIHNQLPEDGQLARPYSSHRLGPLADLDTTGSLILAPKNLSKTNHLLFPRQLLQPKNCMGPGLKKIQFKQYNFAPFYYSSTMLLQVES